VSQGSGVLSSHEYLGQQGGTQSGERQVLAFLKVPLPREEKMQFGSGVLTPQKEKEMQNGSGTSVPSKTVHNTGKVASPKKHSHLPHIDSTEYYQFVTFRTHDSLDEFIQKYNLDSTLSNKEKQLKIDEYLDNSSSGAYLQNEVFDYLYRFLLAQDAKLYDLVAFAIMNNHVHILFKPLESLSMVMKKIKGASAKRINELLGKSGRFWSDDYYDKAIRDERHFWVVYEYIRNNPLKLGQCQEMQNGGGTKVPLPRKVQNGSGVLTPHGDVGELGGTKVPLPSRFYGVFYE